MAIDTTVFWGLPRLKVLDGPSVTATVLKTLYMAPVDKDGIDLVDIPAKGIETRLLGGGTRFISGGYKRKLSLRWALYDPTHCGKVVGTGDGQAPCLADLYDIISQNPGRLLVSPCSSHEIWFRCYVPGEVARNPVGKLVFRNVAIEFTGNDVYQSIGSTTVVA